MEHFTIEHQVCHDWKFKEQHAEVWENIVGAKRYSRPHGFNISGASVPVAAAIPTPLIYGTDLLHFYEDPTVHSVSLIWLRIAELFLNI